MIAKTPTEVEAEVLAKYTALTGRTLLAADPRRLLLQSITAKLSHIYSLVELADRRNLPVAANGEAGADGAYLDALGTFVGVDRSPGAKSVVTLEYSRTVSTTERIIPAGHRATTADGAFLWATSASLTLAIGVLSGTVSSACTVTGPESNDIPAGGIDVLVDPLAGISVVSTTATDGGSDEQTDAEYRPDVVAAPDGFTTCGPRTAYEWHAGQASPLVLDAAALGPDDTDYGAPAAGVVAVFVLVGQWVADADGLDVLDIEDSAVVIAAVLALVLAGLSEDTVRPITDLVTVSEAIEVSYTAEVSYWIRQADAAIVAEINTAVDAAQAAYLDWQDSAMGRDVDPSELHARLYAAGARRITITSPVYAEVERSECARRDGYEAAPNYLGLFE